MIFSEKIDVHRPSRTSDGEGGFSETTTVDAELWANIVFHDKFIEGIVWKFSDVKINDIWQVDTAQYRVIGPVLEQFGNPYKNVRIERIKRPINPN